MKNIVLLTLKLKDRPAFVYDIKDFRMGVWRLDSQLSFCPASARLWDSGNQIMLFKDISDQVEQINIQITYLHN